MFNRFFMHRVFLYMFCVFLLTGCRRQVPVPDGLLAEAYEAVLAGKPSEAKAFLAEFLEQNPQSLTAQANLGLLNMQTGDLTEAVAALNRATELAPDKALLWELLGEILTRTGNAEGALEVLGRVRRPTEITWTRMAIAALHAGRPEGTQHYLERSLKENPYYAPALYNLAVFHRDVQNAPVEALAYYRRFREADPQNDRAVPLDDAFLRQSRLEPAVDQTTAVVNVQADLSVHAMISGMEEQEETEVETEPARIDTSAVAVSDPPPPPVQVVRPATSPARPVSESRKLIQRANVEIADGNEDAALILLKDAVQRYPDDADAVWALAVYYDRHQNLRDRAEGLYATFVHMFPEDPRARARQAAAPPPRPPAAAALTAETLFRKGLEHYNRQEWGAAVDAYRQALSLDPDSASCAYNLGLAYKAKEDLDAAVAAFRHALSLEPEMIKSLYMLGLTEIHRRRNADALSHLNRLIGIQPDFAKAHYLLGSVYQTENRPDAAVFHFDRFLVLEPNDKAAPQVRRWIEQYRR